MNAHIVVSLFTGARTEELRRGETKTPKSRRALELPDRCVIALRLHRGQQAESRLRAGGRWVDPDLVFGTQFGTPLDAANVRRHFRALARAAGLNADQWTPAN